LTPRPARLQLSRKRGFQLEQVSRAANGLPAKTVARPSRWGNPFVIGRDGSQAECVASFRHWVRGPAQVDYRAAARQELAGYNLACWCALGTPCHADVLLSLANP
jgi:hypothetical protein